MLHSSGKVPESTPEGRPRYPDHRGELGEGAARLDELLIKGTRVDVPQLPLAIRGHLRRTLLLPWDIDGHYRVRVDLPGAIEDHDTLRAIPQLPDIARPGL